MSEDRGQISDGYHTFNELYEHRAALFIALMMSHPDLAWVADRHDDGSMFDGFFIVGMDLPTGQVTYHLKRDPWFGIIDKCSAEIRWTAFAPLWDGHTPAEALDRIKGWMVVL